MTDAALTDACALYRAALGRYPEHLSDTTRASILDAIAETTGITPAQIGPSPGTRVRARGWIGRTTGWPIGGMLTVWVSDHVQVQVPAAEVEMIRERPVLRIVAPVDVDEVQ